MKRCGIRGFIIMASASLCLAGAAAGKPNIIFILSDDLGIGDVGCYGQTQIQTPHIDRLAAEGMRFTQAYCGTPVCAPTRCILMTGLHAGHAAIRANRELGPQIEGQKPLPEGTFTVAHLLKKAGYATGCIGKWGMGPVGSSGEPAKMGFDHFFGYNCQRQAHEYYPAKLWRNSEQVQLDGKTYSHDLFHAETLDWVRQHKEGPFFLYLAYTIPHGKFQVPDTKRYDGTSLTPGQKTYAAMISRMDDSVGALVALLKELKIDDNTIVFFSGDNGASHDAFDSNGPFRGMKRSMYEGGLRQASIVRWPGHVPAGRVSDAMWAFWDFLPTCAELAGAQPPADLKLDGFSILPGLLGGKFPEREYLYWELHEGPPKQAVRSGDWKLVRPGLRAAPQLYNLAKDPAEENEVAAANPHVVARLLRYMKEAHTDSPDWPMNPPGSAAQRKVQKKETP